MLTRKSQLLFAHQAAEGVVATLSSSDAVAAYNPAMTEEAPTTGRVPTGASLSRAPEVVGHERRTFTIETDFRGSGSTGTAPEWNKLLQSAGFKAGTVVSMTTGAIGGSDGFQLGEVLQAVSSANRAVIIGLKRTSDSAFVDRLRAAGTIYAVTIKGTMADGTVTGESSQTTATASGTAIISTAYAYKPVSTSLVRLQTAAWSGGSAPHVNLGDVLTFENPTNVTVGAGQVWTKTSEVDFEVAILDGTVDNAYVVRDVAGTGTTTVSSAPTQTSTPAGTAAFNLDGRKRMLINARADFELGGAAGESMVFKWSMTGDVGTDINELPLTGASLSSISPPRMIGGICVIGITGAIGGAAQEIPPIKVKNVRVAPGNTNTVNPDANATNGASGSIISDRDPEITITVDKGMFDWRGARRSATLVRFGYLLGGTLGDGYRVGIFAPYCQVTAVQEGDAGGISTEDVTLKAKRILESGDDELFFVQI